MSFSKKPEKRDTQYRIRMTEKEKQEIALHAKLCGLSMAEYIRRSSLKKRIHSKVDLHAINELRRLGGLQKHLANTTTENTEAFRVEYIQILQSIKETILWLGKKNTRQTIQ